MPLPWRECIKIVFNPGNLCHFNWRNTPTKWFDFKEMRGMTVKFLTWKQRMWPQTTVKNYGWDYQHQRGELQGLWTGGVKFKIQNSYLAIPVVANYKVSKRWESLSRSHVCILLISIERNFSGHVYEKVLAYSGSDRFLMILLMKALLYFMISLWQSRKFNRVAIRRWSGNFCSNI